MCQFTALVVEDDTLQREAIADLLKDRGLEVIECTTAEAAELLEAVLDQPSVLEQPGRGRFHHPSRCLHGPNSVYRLV
jgi:CheY-like chemotaxis protein